MNEIKLKGELVKLENAGVQIYDVTKSVEAEILLTPQDLILQLPDMTLYGYSLKELGKIINFAKSEGFNLEQNKPKEKKIEKIKYPFEDYVKIYLNDENINKISITLDKIITTLNNLVNEIEKLKEAR